MGAVNGAGAGVGVGAVNEVTGVVVANPFVFGALAVGGAEVVAAGELDPRKEANDFAADVAELDTAELELELDAPVEGGFAAGAPNEGAGFAAAAAEGVLGENEKGVEEEVDAPKPAKLPKREVVEGAGTAAGPDVICEPNKDAVDVLAAGGAAPLVLPAGGAPPAAPSRLGKPRIFRVPRTASSARLKPSPGSSPSLASSGWSSLLSCFSAPRFMSVVPTRKVCARGC